MRPGAPAPVARVWQMTGGDLAGDEVTRLYAAEFRARLEQLPGYLGVLVLVDRERRVLRGVSFWSDADARSASATTVGPNIRTIQERLGVRVSGPWSYDVAFSDVRAMLVRPDEVSRRVLVRAGRLIGGDVAAPDLLDVMKRYAEGGVVPAPGCLGSLLLVDPDGPEVLMSSFWVDEHSARRMDAATSDAVDLVAATARSQSSDTGTFEVLVGQPLRQRVS